MEELGFWVVGENLENSLRYHESIVEVLLPAHSSELLDVSD